MVTMRTFSALVLTRNRQSSTGNRQPVPLGLSDGLDRLAAADRGTLDDPPAEGLLAGSTSFRQDWALDPVGNWDTFRWDPDGQSGWTTQSRAHNKANEIAGHGGNPIYDGPAADWIDPAYDARGNMTEGPAPGYETTANKRQFYTYDAWNRLMKVVEDTDGDGDPEGTDEVLAEYRYDGAGRRIRKYTDEPPTGYNWTVREYYYNTSWQVLEVRKQIKSRETGEPELAETLYEQYVWSVRYIDALVLRDRDTGGDPDLDERLYYCNDANMNVTALVAYDDEEETWVVVERCVYDPYGKVKFYDKDWGTPSDSSSYDNEILYCGYRFDSETKLYHVRNRTYHPSLGRWLQRDPDPTDQDAAGMNLYEYCTSNPPIYTDIDGMRPANPLYELGAHGLPTGVKQGALTERERRDAERQIALDEQLVLAERAKERSRDRSGEVSVRLPMPGGGFFVMTYREGQHIRTVFPGRHTIGVDWDCFWKCFDKYSSSVIFQIPGVGTALGGMTAALTTPIAKATGLAKLGGATAKTTLGSRILGRTFRNLMKRPAARIIGMRAATAVGRVGSKAIPIAGWVLLAWDGSAAYACLLECPKEVCVMPDGTVKEINNE